MKNDTAREQSLKMSQLKDDQYVPASLLSSASEANLQPSNHPSGTAHDLSPGIDVMMAGCSSSSSSSSEKSEVCVIICVYDMHRQAPSLYESSFFTNVLKYAYCCMCFYCCEGHLELCVEN